MLALGDHMATSPRVTHILMLLLLSAMLVGAAVPGVSAHDNEPIGASGDVIPVSSLGKSAIGVRVETVRKTSLPMQISVPGKIEVIPTREFDQHAPLSGRISKLLVSLGDKVSAGQVLAVIDSPEMNQLAAELLQSKMETESEYARQKAALDEEVRQADRRMVLAESNRQRMRKLQDEKIAAQKDVIAADNEYDLAEMRLKTAQENRTIIMQSLKSRIHLTGNPLKQRLQMLGVDHKNLDGMLKNQTTMTSVPVKAARSGVLTDIQASPGMSIEPSVRLFTIADLSVVWATAQVYEDDMSRMHLGEKVQVIVHALAGEKASGALTFIGSHVDPETRTLPVRAELLNPNERLKPDMFAELSIQTAESSPMIALPHDAVIQRGGHNVVFVELQDGYQPTFVKLGRNVGDSVEVVEGLHAGQRVVVRGAFQLGAQLVKDRGGEAQFSSPTEGEHIEDLGDKPRGELSLNVQTVFIIIATAFLLGFGLSAVFLVRNKSSRNSGSTPPNTVPNELPVVKPTESKAAVTQTPPDA